MPNIVIINARLRSKKGTIIQTDCEPYSIFFFEEQINILREKKGDFARKMQIQE